ncbi:TolC family protein [Cyclobacterium jeungdonense]|uniref:TolC family protein n=1 Tax=Cyclobacterium jeungdonense TaxID=708087 RepID=A0ABT8CAI2_9BACT|nr:TolC family protein [Cyclobacterium jeungdonense]MDN3688633.1 TolC family protein [Cyclobacterium jeungdonense]
MKHILLVFLLGLGQISAGWSQDTAGKLSLEQCVAIALENNLNLRRSELNLVSSEATLMETRGQHLPSFSMGGSSGFRWGRSINPVTNLFETRRIGNVNISASSSLPIFAGGQIRNSVKQATLNVETDRLNLAASRNDITLNTINLFINIAFAKEQLKIANSQLTTSRDQLSRTQKLVAAGSLPMADQLDLQAQTATNELEVINAENNLRIARLNLSQALQLPFTEDFDILIPELEVDGLSVGTEGVEQIYSVAVSSLPEIKAAEYGVQAAEYGIKIAKGAYLPSLNLSANVFSNYVDQTNFTTSDPILQQFENNLSQSANVGLSIPIFSNFRNQAGVQRARVQKRLSEIQEIEVKNLLRQDIESAYTSAYAARQSYRSSQLRVEALEEAFRMAQQRFDVGAINAVDFQVAQNNLFNAQADLVTSKYEYVFSVKVLDFYLGNPLTL